MKKKKSAQLLPFGLFLLISLISAIGLLFVFEASLTESMAQFGHPYFFLKRQSLWLMLGMIGLSMGTIIPLEWWKKMAPFAFIGAIGLLLLLFVPGLGQTFNGAQRWLSVGSYVIQPTEFVKLGIILFFSAWLSKHQKIAPFLFLTLLPCSLIMLQPDLGSTLVVATLAFSLYFVAGGNVKHLSVLGFLGVAVVLVAIMGSEYRRERIATFLNPELDPLGSSFHIRQITLALGRGGLFGQGLGNSQQRNSFLPEPSTDSIMAIVGEETGFIGSFILISLYGLLLWMLYSVANKQPEGSFEYLLGAGILIWIALQMILNLAAVVALVPLTGVPLPLFSYGGSSLITILFALGFSIQLARR